MSFLTHISGSIQGKHPLTTTRSSHWPVVRKEHLAKKPVCALCGGNVKIEVHHIQPFHLRPDLELDLNNLITLCEEKKNGINCHLAFGHLGNYKSYNQNVVEDADVWSIKIKERP